MDHERVFVRMDGSTRLTTRNRIFVKKIISPQELPDQNVMQDPSVPVMLGASNDEDTNAQGHIEDTDGMGDHSSVQQQGMGHNETVVSLMWSLEPVEYRVKSQTKSPSRPQRTRKPNKGFYGISVR